MFSMLPFFLGMASVHFISLIHVSQYATSQTGYSLKTLINTSPRINRGKYGHVGFYCDELAEPR